MNWRLFAICFVLFCFVFLLWIEISSYFSFYFSTHKWHLMCQTHAFHFVHTQANVFTISLANAYAHSHRHTNTHTHAEQHMSIQKNTHHVFFFFVEPLCSSCVNWQIANCFVNVRITPLKVALRMYDFEENICAKLHFDRSWNDQICCTEFVVIHLNHECRWVSWRLHGFDQHIL